MEKESRKAVYDAALELEAFRFRGLSQPFPAHFHEYYVFGLVENGRRELVCGGKRCVVESGCVLLFSPGESHGCVQCGGALDYRGINVPEQTVINLLHRRVLPRFEKNVLQGAELRGAFRDTHKAVMNRSVYSERLELMERLLSLLERECGGGEVHRECRNEVESACEFIRLNYARRVSLDELCRHVGLSRAALGRAFAADKGISPHRYLESVRVSRAGSLLSKGVPPCQSAVMTGFSDQSHFTNRFRALTGLAPGLYGGIFRDEDGEKRHGS